MKITLLGYVALLGAIFAAGFLVSCKKSHQTPAPAIDSLKVGLVAYYPFDNTGADSSGNNNNGTVYDITSATDRFGNVMGAYYFNGTSSYISVPDNQSLRLNNTNFTLNAWIKTGAYSSSYAENILAKRIAGANNGWIFGILGEAVSPTGVIDFGPGGGAINAFGITAVSLNQWHMLTVIYMLSKLQIDMYIDGAQIGTVTGTYNNGVFGSSSSGVISPNASESALMYIGRDDPSQPDNYFFNGSMDDIRIYSRAISKNQIQQLFTATN
jgi:hypothetical protein